MAWLRIDDGFTEHAKLIGLKRSERWTWLELLTYCARRQEGGHVPEGIVDVLRWVTPAFLERCVTLGLIDRAEDGSMRVHNWEKYNPKDPTKADRQARWRANRNGAVDTDVDAPVDENGVYTNVYGDGPSRAGQRARGPSRPYTPQTPRTGKRLQPITPDDFNRLAQEQNLTAWQRTIHPLNRAYNEHGQPHPYYIPNSGHHEGDWACPIDHGHYPNAKELAEHLDVCHWNTDAGKAAIEQLPLDKPDQPAPTTASQDDDELPF